MLIDAHTRTADAFGRSVRYEIAFWQMAYTGGASDRA
jgi:thiaminase